MRIVADANIPLLAEAFGPLGEVVALPADQLTPDAVRDADALLVRSVTPVNAALLDGSKVRFVATATIGFDHIDQPYLAARGIGFASAQGSNANSVAEYVLTALAVLAERGEYSMLDQTLGIVGCGNVGGRLARKAKALGMKVLMNDPPLARKTGDPEYVPLEALAAADVITFHVPLSREGPDATYHMVSAGLLHGLKCGATLINSSRGSVVDTPALKAAMEAGHLGAVIMDVWEKEPNIDVALLGEVDLATPHIAGYSYDGKVNGTRMVMEALCRHFGVERQWDSSPLMPPPAKPRVRIPAGATLDEAIRLATAAAYDIEGDDARLRALAKQPPEARAKYFNDLRKKYPVRREFPETVAELERDDARVQKALEALGFRVTKTQ